MHEKPSSKTSASFNMPHNQNTTDMKGVAAASVLSTTSRLLDLETDIASAPNDSGSVKFLLETPQRQPEYNEVPSKLARQKCSATVSIRPSKVSAESVKSIQTFSRTREYQAVTSDTAATTRQLSLSQSLPTESRNKNTNPLLTKRVRASTSADFGGPSNVVRKRVSKAAAAAAAAASSITDTRPEKHMIPEDSAKLHGSSNARMTFSARPDTAANTRDQRIMALAEGRGVAAEVGICLVHLNTGECALSQASLNELIREPGTSKDLFNCIN